jgi:hypothetical protein
VVEGEEQNLTVKEPTIVFYRIRIVLTVCGLQKRHRFPEAMFVSQSCANIDAVPGGVFSELL